MSRYGHLMIRFPRIPALLCILNLVSHPGCSIREDRDLCPCRLVLDLPSGTGETALWLEMRTAETDAPAESSDGAVAGTAVTHKETLPAGTKSYHTAVPRGSVSLMAWTTGSSDGPDRLPLAMTESEIRIPEGEECPELRLFRRTYDTRCEQVRDTVRFRKEFCMLNLQVLSLNGLYELAVRGQYCGFGPGERLLKGPFYCRMQPDGTGRVRVRIPRQGDDSLVLELRNGVGAVKSFALGEYLRESGYDWTAADLADADILIDYVRSSVTLSLGRWTVVIPIRWEI